MVDALRVERERLQADNPTVRAYTHDIDFELLWGSANMLSRPYQPNREQFFAAYPDVKSLAAEHDAALERLKTACVVAFERLLADPNFAALCAGRADAERRGLAELVVNNEQRLADYHPLAGAWKERGASLLALRKQPALVEFFAAVTAEIAELRAAVDRLESRMSALQQELAADYQLPAVDPRLAG